MARALDLARTFLQLDDGPAVREIPVDEAFWASIGERSELHAGRLVMRSRCAADWDHWEMHPAGDEVVCLLSGAVDMVLETADGDEVVALRAGAACVVPAGIWHRAVVREPGELLFITRGAGTQHRPL